MNRLTMTMVVWMAVLALVAPLAAQQEMSEAEDPDDMGKTAVGRTYFPVPKGAETFEVPNGSFEKVEKGSPVGWAAHHVKVAEGDAPEGERYLTFDGEGRYNVYVDDITIRGNAPHLLSMWARTTEPVSVTVFCTDAPSRWGRTNWMSLPSTGGEWKRVGFYFRPMAGASKARIQIRQHPRNRDKAAPFAVDDVRFRTATEPEYMRAYKAWRERYPERDLSPRPTDGQNLALTIEKLEKGFDPERPFLIWAIGSSYTNMLGMGDTVRQTIYDRFGFEPEIVYKKHVGSAVPWKYIRGWYNHQVQAEQPDLIQIYTIGNPDDLEKLLRDIRKTSTADIIVPSIHWRIRDRKNWGKTENAVDQDVSKVRAICKKYGVEFVESRREWAEYMMRHNMKVEVDAEEGLLKDNVHQSDYGALIINENIARHFAHPKEFNYNPRERERRLNAAEPKSIRPVETVVADDGWKTDGDRLTTSKKGAELTVTFQGNRIDLIGLTATGGGEVDVFIDGKPASEAPGFFKTAIVPGSKNNQFGRGLKGDRAPHGIELGSDVIPQEWTIRMIDNQGRYELVGSVTGKDGEGLQTEDFTSASGQIVVPAELWRNAGPKRRGKHKGEFENRKGDTFTFEVVRACTSAVTFDGEKDKPFRVMLAGALPNERHTLKLVVRGNGPVTVEAFDVFEPPLK